MKGSARRKDKAGASGPVRCLLRNLGSHDAGEPQTGKPRRQSGRDAGAEKRVDGPDCDERAKDDCRDEDDEYDEDCCSVHVFCLLIVDD